jgi:hypothetical protein
LNEFIFKASDNGQLYIDAATNNKVILRPGDNTSTSGCATKRDEDYTITVVNLTRLQEPGPMEQCIYTFAALVTDQLEDAITAEVVLLLLSLPTM